MMAEGGSTSITDVTVTETIIQESPPSPPLRLKLKKPKPDKKVKWTSETVDNENMGKKKSKCCCVYEKPRSFGESSSEDEGEDGCSHHCRGHKKKCYQGHGPEDHHDNGAGPSTGGESNGGDGMAASS
ncbi:E3 ubiquitin-protein ligase PPP1R11-like [Haliotis rufescens]|uniref:E3 ubiquitin-protein ligase PPP1R11-like n=1 Tax=Haliotis rufescens TaxID=6454 RepID=UPI00201FB33E|nr:E3 ubiquitin-protein ligase PPP1R11-like [Haliotis rufescens]